MIILAGSIIITLSNSGIINKANEAVEKTDLATVKNLAALKWAEAYMNENIKDKEDYENYVLDGLKTAGINVDDYKITVNESGVQVTLSVPSEWRQNVAEIVDGVPIPKGFVASEATGENTKVGGLVIYEGTEAVTAANIDKAITTRNQYVWIPVARELFLTTFVRESNEYFEVVVDPNTNLPLPTLAEQNETYMSDVTLDEVQAMYASVKEYGGFYIARYEAGIDSHRVSETDSLISGSDVHIKMGKIPYNNIKWSTSGVDNGAAVEVARGLYPANDTTNVTGVVSTLMYGVQWDRILAWWKETDSTFFDRQSRYYGNYRNNEISTVDLLNNDALIWDYSTNENGTFVAKVEAKYPKTSGTKWLLSTGALKAAKINNIYDIAGNLWEWTMEVDSNGMRFARGGSFTYNIWDTTGAKLRYSTFGTYYNVGFRPALYIKL